MKKIFNRAKFVMTGEEGASNIEIIVWMSVVAIIATALFFFKDAVVAFVGNMTNVVKGLKTK